MAIDIRADVNCSLGPVISGSIGDDYLQGSGLVKSTGNVVINGLITPAIGTVVTFTYTKNGVTRSIPRRMRVLSSFADPFRRTTSVELGCKLTYLSDLKEALSWTWRSDANNSSYTESDANFIVIPISASSVAQQCLAKLGLVASSIPLTSRFSTEKIDFSGGYVDLLSDLLVSESYFGYLDVNEVLQIRPLTEGSGLGPVLTSSEIIDISPINSGSLPGESVTVSYSTYKLRVPTEEEAQEAVPTEEEAQEAVPTPEGDPPGGVKPPPENPPEPSPEPDPEAEEDGGQLTPENVERINWERVETYSSPQKYYISYTIGNENYTVVYSGSFSSVATTQYKILNIKKKEPSTPGDPSGTGYKDLSLVGNSENLPDSFNLIGLVSSLSSEQQEQFLENPTTVLEEEWPDAEKYDYVGDGTDEWVYNGSSWELNPQTPKERFETDPESVLSDFFPDARPYDYVGSPEGKWISSGSGWTKEGPPEPPQVNDIEEREVPSSRTTINYGPSISALSSVAQQYLTIGVDFNNVTLELSRVLEEFNYDEDGNQTATTRRTFEDSVVVLASSPLKWADEQGFFVATYGDQLLTDIVIQSNRSEGNYTEDVTESYMLQSRSQDGQQQLASAAEGGTSQDSPRLAAVILDSGVVHVNTTVTVSRKGTTVSQGRPSQADRNKSYYAKNPTGLFGNADDQTLPPQDSGSRGDSINENNEPKSSKDTSNIESVSEIVLALGSPAAQRRTEFSLPYAPDDSFFGPPGGPFFSIRSNAESVATRFGRIQNRLLLGNRSGINLQLTPERLPDAPFDPIYVQANGLTALYRINASSWAFDGGGIVASTDALFWAAVGGTGAFWFPVAPGITSLPETPPVVDGQMDATAVVLPYNETLVCEARIRLRVTIARYAYGLESLTEVPPLTTYLRAEVFDVTLLSAEAGNLVITDQAAALIRRSFLSGASGNFALTGLNAGNVRTRSIGTNAGVFTAAAEQAGLLFGRLPLNAEDTAFAASGQTALLRIFTTYLLAGSGDFTLTGQEATSPQTYLGVESGTFLLDTPTTDLSRSSVLRADGGIYSATGQSADLQYIQVVAPVKVLFYTGNGATERSITGAGFEPGFVGIKGRTFAMNHAWHDIVRGKNTAGYLWVRAGESAPEQIPDTGSTISTRGVQSFTADGFTMNGSSIVNFSGANYFALCLEKGSNVSANANGSITTQVSTQSDLEYSAFTYTGNGTANQTIGHGLSGSPELVIIKQRTGDFSWVGGTVVGDNNFLRFTNNTVTETSTALFQSFNSSTIAIGDTFNQNNFTYCGWAFKSKTGKSSISTFTGSGSGQHVVNLGYKPQFVMIKNTASTTGDWLVYYTLDGATGYAKELKFNTTDAEVTSTTVQITSTGFSVDVGGPGNISGGATSALYLAFADFSPPPPLVMVSSAGSYLVSGSDSNLGTVYNVTNSGASSYLINEAANPTLTVIRGVTYFFDVNAPGHPFWLQTTAGAYDSLNTYSVGVTSGGTAEGRITWQVALDAPSPLYYVCQFHSSMNGQINVVNYALKLDVGSFTLDGQSSILQPAIRLPADLGEFVFSGQSVGSVSNAVLSGATGVYEVSVADVALITNLLLIATEDNFTLSGFSSDAFILKAFIAPGSSSFDLNGQLAEFTRTAALESAAASYALSGLPVALVYQDLGPTVSVGTEAPLLGATGAVDFTGWTRIQNANADDANIQVTGWPFTFTLANTGYTSGFVGSNSYITFGGGSSAYSGLSASNPNFPKIHFGAADNSYQRVYTKIEDDKVVRIRYEGNGSTSGTLGSPGIVVELAFFKPSASGEQLVELRVGNHNRTSGLFMIASASTSYASATIAANSSWVFVGNNTGTSWTLTSNRYVSQPVRNLTMTASAGSYQATGQDVQLSIILGASLDAGSLLLNGQTADFVVSLSLAAERGVYSVIGENLGSDNYFSSWAIQTFGYESLIYPDWWAD